MSYQERRAIVYLASTVLITVLYSAFMIQRYPQADAYSPEVMHYWGAFFLILIPVSVIARVLILIVFAIINVITTQEEDPEITDERDKMIELKATQNSLYVFMAGFLVAMIVLVAGLPPAAMFIILICAGTASEMVSEISQFYFYRRGF